MSGLDFSKPGKKGRVDKRASTYFPSSTFGGLQASEKTLYFHRLGFSPFSIVFISFFSIKNFLKICLLSFSFY
jgi:hypothetical protein